MKFENRIVEHTGRKRLTVVNQENDDNGAILALTVDVARAEGAVTESGTPLTKATFQQLQIELSEQIEILKEKLEQQEGQLAYLCSRLYQIDELVVNWVQNPNQQEVNTIEIKTTEWLDVEINHWLDQLFTVSIKEHTDTRIVLEIAETEILNQSDGVSFQVYPFYILLYPKNNRNVCLATLKAQVTYTYLSETPLD